MRDANYPLQAKRGSVENIVAVHVYLCLCFIITLSIVIKCWGMMIHLWHRSGDVSENCEGGCTRCVRRKAITPSKINIEEDMNNSHLDILILTLYFYFPSVSVQIHISAVNLFYEMSDRFLNLNYKISDMH